ncbi:MAG: sigma-70 family RNA polymerase sigma factor [Sphingomonadales bacterium]|nr:sigma-70 family RNA polymerase sigma factor [Sphingomonadales bacterium]MDE2569016.1 sigma-70 family RNA polymerase sigma factor [Sphingomonadales bacterium]
MKHDHRSFASASPPGPRSVSGAYRGEVADRVRRFLPMVRRLAWHVHGSGRAGLEIEDLIQAGLVALTEAAQKHDAPTEDGFAAYAKLRVRGAMVDLLRRASPLSRPAAERRRALREAEGRLEGELGRPPEPPELAAAMGLTEHELAAMRAASEPVRLESMDDAYTDQDMAFADTRPDSFALLADAETRLAVASAIAALPERLQLVISLYFVEELNLAEIAEVFEVSVPRVHQLKAQALDKLRALLGEDYAVL